MPRSNKRISIDMHHPFYYYPRFYVLFCWVRAKTACGACVLTAAPPLQPLQPAHSHATRSKERLQS